MFRHTLNRQYDPLNNSLFYTLAKGSESLLQRMSLMQVMDVHRGCVNTVVWDEPGNLLLSGSDDQNLVICDPWERMTKTRIHTAHRANIFSAKFIPQTANRKIISCSGDGILVFTDLEREEETHDCKFNCHVSTCYDIITVPDDPHTFLTCGEDGTVRWFDLRVKEQCTIRNCQEDVLLNMGRAVTAVAVNPITPYHLAVATQDSTIRIYDRRILGTKATDSFLEQSDRALVMKLKPDNMEGKNHRVTSLRYSQDGREVLASYSSDYLYLFDTENFKEVSLNGIEDTDAESETGPTLKRLRLRGDWSDTGPQALPESEMRSQAGDVGQARPTLHATLMQRMTDVLSRMLNDPSSRAPGQPGAPDLDSSRNRSDSVSDSISERDVAHNETAEANPSGPLLTEDQPSTSAASLISQTGESSTNLSETSTAPCALGASSSVAEDNKPSLSCDVESSSVLQQNESDDSQAKPTTSRAERHQLPDEEGPFDVMDPSIEGLQDRISSLRQGFVEKHQVEPSVNLSYSSQGVTSSMIRIGVGDEVTRDSNSSDMKDDVVPSSSELEEGRKSNSEAVPECRGNKHESTLPDQASRSSSSTSLSSSSSSSVCQPAAVRTHTITTSSSSPAICDMEVGSENVTTGASSSHGTRASELNLGPAIEFGDDDSDDESTGTRNQRHQNHAGTGDDVSASARMASAIERAAQRVRGERASGSGGEAEKTVPQAAVKQCYKGHRNARTMIKEACFWGDTHIMSGSDCGRVFVWERKTGRLVMLWEADRHVVNCLQPHPTLPVLATSGIDYDLKLWAPVCDESRFDEEKALEITKRNEALLEETRDTITVPATFMIRMLASLNQIRRGTFAERWRSRRQARRHEDDQSGNAEEN
ncbi:LOW QUALITY PROTEIN: DDB1- and CUL4-associated factor 6-like [Macrobrachium nipponense]|uniref:LOW QUALITY PROTEIN: DDB1- and CUL4-associated factor 6-like n=1 Tax=Macrobrachium nipponense TaxID=159736 RepID=UPI0030C88397